MTKLRWYAVAATVAALGLMLAMAHPALRGAVLSGGGWLAEPWADPSPSPGPSNCPVSEKLVPECGAWWGVAPGVFTSTPSAQALTEFEIKTDRHADIYHRYHRGDELFPTEDEIAAARDPNGPRVLLLNWKVAWGTTWADVAAGGQDARIDRLAAHVNETFDEPFFLAIHHEPENDVRTEAESGMTAADYAAMYRHTVERLRAQGVDNAVYVMAYMGWQGWGTKPWFDELYPGDDVVDWIGYDPYVTADPDAYHHGDFATLVNQTDDPKTWPGFYDWATAEHPGKPLMLAEWGVFEYPDDHGRKADIFASVERQLPDFPALKALVYFDSPNAPKGDTRIDSSKQALEVFRDLGALPLFSIIFPGTPGDPSPSASPSGAPGSPSLDPSGSPSPAVSGSPSPGAASPSAASPSVSLSQGASPSPSATVSPNPAASSAPPASTRPRQIPLRRLSRR